MPTQLFLRAPGGLRALQGADDDTVASVCGLEVAEALNGGVMRVVHEGRTLDPRATLRAAGVAPGATLELLPRLCGGGGDGGATGAESRSSYLEMYARKKHDKVDPNEERLARWTTCQISGMPLSPPCVADELGSLFNKDAVLQALVSKQMPKGFSHISSLKHLIELKLEEAPAGFDGGQGVRFACPVTGQAFNGKSRFVVLRRSGHVVSERAVKEVPKVVAELTGASWEPADLLPVNPSGDELQAMREALLLKRAAGRAAKKGKKSSKAAAANGDAPAAAAAAAGGGSAAEAAVAANGGKRALDGGAGGAPAGAPAGQAAAQGKRFKAAELKPKGADVKVWSSLFTSSNAGQEASGSDYMTRGALKYVV